MARKKSRKKKNPGVGSHKGRKLGKKGAERWVSEAEIDKAVKRRLLSKPAVIDKLMTDFIAAREEQRSITEEQIQLKNMLKDERGKPERKLIDQGIKDLEARKKEREKDARRLRKSINEYYSASLRDAEERLSLVRMMPAAPTHRGQISEVERMVKAAKAGKKISGRSAPIVSTDDPVPRRVRGDTPWYLQEGVRDVHPRGAKSGVFSDQRNEFRELRAALLTLEDTVSKTVVRRGAAGGGGARRVQRPAGGITAGSPKAAQMAAEAFPSRYKGWVHAMRQETLVASQKFLGGRPTTRSVDAMRKVWENAAKKLLQIPGMKRTAALFLQFSEIGELKIADIREINRLKASDVSFAEIARAFRISEKSVAHISSTTKPEDRIPDIRHVAMATGFDHGTAKAIRKIYMDGQFISLQFEVMDRKMARGEPVTKADIRRVERKLDVIFGVAKVSESRLTLTMARADIKKVRASIKEAKDLGLLGDASNQRILMREIRDLGRKYSGAGIAEWPKKQRGKILEDISGLEAMVKVAKKGVLTGPKRAKKRAISVSTKPTKRALAAAAKKTRERKAAKENPHVSVPRAIGPWRLKGDRMHDDGGAHVVYEMPNRNIRLQVHYRTPGGTTYDRTIFDLSRSFKRGEPRPRGATGVMIASKTWKTVKPKTLNEAIAAAAKWGERAANKPPKKNPIRPDEYLEGRARRGRQETQSQEARRHSLEFSVSPAAAARREQRAELGELPDPKAETTARAMALKARGGKRRIIKPGGQMKVISAKENPGRRDARDFILSAAGDASQGFGMTRAEIRSVWSGKQKDFDETYTAMRQRGLITTSGGHVTLTRSGQRPFTRAHKRWEDQAIMQANPKKNAKKNPKKNASSITDRARVSIFEFLENGETKDAAWDDWMTFGGGDDAAFEKAWGLAVRSGEIKKAGASKYKTTQKGTLKRYDLMGAGEVDPPMLPARRNPKKKATKRKATKKKATKKKVARKKTPPYQLLINRCHKLWTHYCERPSKKRLEAIYVHLDKMKESTSQKVKAERSRCLRGANAEAKKLKYKRK